MSELPNKRVVIIHWKKRDDFSFEVFSNLKILCSSYPEYNYNTLNNYLSKAKTPYENDTVRIERKNLISKTKSAPSQFTRQIAPVVHRSTLKDAKENNDDFDFWKLKSAIQRLAAVTFLMSQMLQKNERMDKNIVKRIKMKT